MTGRISQNLNQNRFSKRRILLLCVGFFIWAAIIDARLVYFQVYKHEQMAALAEQQQQRTLKTCPKRGSIYDRKGRELARSVEVESVYAAPKEILAEKGSPEEMAKRLAQILDMPEEVLLSRLKSSKVLVSIKRKLSDKESELVRAMDYPGIHFITETKRSYPKDDLASYIVGFVGMEEEGFSGVERQYDKHIQGRPGYVFVETDAHGRPFGRYEKASEPGQSLFLTVDEQIQYRTEKALREAVDNVGAKGGTAIVMRPKTGEILAMATLPGYNPNEPIKDGNDLRENRRNRAVEDTYEPGSVFKMVTYSAAIENKILKLQDKIDCQGGAITIAGHTIKDGGHYGSLTVEEAVAVSSNVAAIKTGKRVGKDLLLDMISRFGFGKSTGVGLPGESPGFVGGTKNWSEASFGALPIGYQVSVTPLQVVAAMSSIANGGTWVQPHVLKQIMSTTGDVIYQPQVQTRTVISKETAQAMKTILEGVVVKGTAKLARLDGYSSAGKTGTAHKFDHATGRYAPNKYYASFCGFAPVNNPEIAVVVVIDEPRLGQHHGGQAAAPGFKQIAEMALRLLSVPPDHLNNQYSDDLPSVNEEDIPYEEEFDINNNDIVKEQNQYADASQLSANLAANLKNKGYNPDTETAIVAFSDGEGSIVMPDLKGQGIRSALQHCKDLGLRLTFEGTGEIAEQIPEAGTAVQPGSECRVILKKVN